MSVTTVFQENESTWLRLSGFLVSVEWHGAN